MKGSVKRCRAFMLGMFALTVAAMLTGCHETIHIHPWESNEEVRLKLRVTNDAPKLGAIIDYTINPPVIIYSDEVPEKAMTRAPRTPHPGDDRFPSLEGRARSLAEAFEEIAPYELDGDNWELHLKYEIYAGSFDDVRAGQSLIHTAKAIFRADDLHPVHDVEIELPFGTVTVVAVGHIVPAGHDADFFYETSTLHTIISNLEMRNGEYDNVYRDCFVTAQQFHTEPTGIDGHVQYLEAVMTRPQGRYFVLADDYEDYLSVSKLGIDDAKGSIYYPSYINIAYSLLSRLPVASGFNFGYVSDLQLTQADGKPYVRLGDDWSFVNGDRSNFNVDISVKDRSDDTLISNSPGVLVPLFPDMVTLVVGHWLTEQAEGGGGVMIDPGFTDEIVLHF